jgi:hypothetical protein
MLTQMLFQTVCAAIWNAMEPIAVDAMQWLVEKVLLGIWVQSSSRRMNQRRWQECQHCPATLMELAGTILCHSPSASSMESTILSRICWLWIGIAPCCSVGEELFSTHSALRAYLLNAPFLRLPNSLVLVIMTFSLYIWLFPLTVHHILIDCTVYTT